MVIPFRGYSLGERVDENVSLDVLGDDDFDNVPSDKSRYDPKDIEALNVQTSELIGSESNNKILVDATNRVNKRAMNYIR